MRVMSEEKAKLFGAQLKLLRGDRTCASVAQEGGYSRVHLSALENARYPVSENVARRVLASCYHITREEASALLEPYFD